MARDRGVTMIREKREEIIREAYDKLREGFVPEHPAFDDLKRSEQAAYRVFANHVINVSAEINHKPSIDLESAREEILQLRARLAEYKVKDKAYNEVIDRVVNGLRTIEQIGEENRRLRGALINLAEKLVNGLPVDVKNLPNKLRGLISISGPEGFLL